jgi:phage-related protein
VSTPSPPDVIFEGDSKKIIKRFPSDVRADLGGDLRRVQNGEKPLDSGPMGDVLRGVFELRADDADFWYRVFYWVKDGQVYVLHCFKKKTNNTSQNDIQIGKKRLSDLKLRLQKGKKH